MTEMGNLLAHHLFSMLLCALLAAGAGAISPLGGALAPVMETATMTIDDYARANARWEVLHGNHTGNVKLNLNVRVPSLDIYDPEGQLVFHGENPAKSAELLHRLPAELKNLKPVTPQQSLSRALEVVADFQKKTSEISSAKRYTIYSTTATKCAPCKPQEQAMDEIVSKKGLGMNVLRLTLQN